MWAVKGLAMEKWLCWASMGVAGLVFLLFVLDLIVKIPFGGLNAVVDIIGAVACILIFYMSYDTFKELR